MSTRCRIGIKNENGTITSIYCHHDGYPEGVGKTLVENYQTEEKIRKLLALGDMSSLGNEPVDNPNAWNDAALREAMKNGNYLEAYKQLNPDDMCNTYKSRGEDVPASDSEDEKQYLKDTDSCWGEFAYLFKDGQWFVKGIYAEEMEEPLDWITVDEALRRNK